MTHGNAVQIISYSGADDGKTGEQHHVQVEETTESQSRRLEAGGWIGPRERSLRKVLHAAAYDDGGRVRIVSLLFGPFGWNTSQ